MIDFQNDVLNSNLLHFQIFPSPEAENMLPHCVGQNKKKLFVVTNEQEHGVGLIDFLEKIFAAVNYDLKKDASHLILQPNRQFCFSDFCKKMDIGKVIFFGLIPQQAGLNFSVTLYQPISFNQKIFLFADDLKTIQNKPALKKLLWGALKEIFLD